MSTKRKRKQSRKPKGASQKGPKSPQKSLPQRSPKRAIVVSILLTLCALSLVYYFYDPAPPAILDSPNSLHTSFRSDEDQAPLNKEADLYPITILNNILSAEDGPEQIILSLKEESLHIGEKLEADFGRIPETLFIYGHIYRQLGKSEQAASHWQETIE